MKSQLTWAQRLTLNASNVASASMEQFNKPRQMESETNLTENGNLPEVSVEDQGMKCPVIHESFQTQAPSNETSESSSDPSASENQKFEEFLDVASEDEDSFRSESEGDVPVWHGYDEEVVNSEYAPLKEVLSEMMLASIDAEIPIDHGKYFQNSGIPNDHR